jgi:phospholipase A1
VSRRRSSVAAGAAILSLWLGPLQAQTAIDWKECLGVSGDSERLACYDARAGRSMMMTLPSSAATPAPPPSAAPAAADATPAHPGGAQSGYWELDPADKRGTFNYTAFHANFLLPLRLMNRVNQTPSSPSRGADTAGPDYKRVETEVQFSMRTKAAQDLLLPGADLWLAYTQQSMWQMWSLAQSAPMRNSNYQPEVIYVVPTPVGWQRVWQDWNWRMTQLAVVHQSNGQADPLSRGWNRLYALIGADSDRLSATVRFEKTLGTASDNPDIAHYLGRLQAELGGSIGRATLNALWRPMTGGRGSAQLEWTYPVHDARPDGLRWYLLAFEGYGATLVDYNFRQVSLGAGFTIFKF